MIYAMSDIHGCLKDLKRKMEMIPMEEGDRLILLGDYIDYGPCSGQVLHYVRDLQQRYGNEKVVVLKGNHEAMFLEWIDEYNRELTPGMEQLCYDSWLKTDSEHRFNTFRTLVSEEQLDRIEGMTKTSSFAAWNIEAAKMVMENHADLISWIRCLPSFYKTQTQIFVHAGVDEEAEDYWEWGTGEEVFLWKHPASLGRFYMTIVAGHVGARSLARDRDFDGIYYDGASHYYIDGSVYAHGNLLLLGYDEKEDRYYRIENGKRIPITKFERD